MLLRKSYARVEESLRNLKTSQLERNLKAGNLEYHLYLTDEPREEN